MSNNQLLRARDLIQQKKYHEARELLQKIDHPTAKQWLVRLNQIAPPPASGSAVTPLGSTASAASAPELSSSPPGSIEQLTRQTLQEAHTLIKQNRLEEARVILSTISHPTATQWLEKINQKLAAELRAPAAAPPRSPSVAIPPEEANRDVLIQAQHAMLKGQYDAARQLLEQLNSIEANEWLEKVTNPKFRSHENIWLDIYAYALEREAGADWETWHCSHCGADVAQMRTLTCPQRGTASCPVKLQVRMFEMYEPQRLAAVLQKLYEGQPQAAHQDLQNIEPDLLKRWQSGLEWQLKHMWDNDVRRPVITAAIPLLGKYC